MGQIPEIHNGLSPTIKHNIISSNIDDMIVTGDDHDEISNFQK